jgi:hypothetical protein
MTIRGERALTRLYRVGSSGEMETADALDAGTVIRELDNNLAHLVEESVRHLVVDNGGYDLTPVKNSDYASRTHLNASDVNVPSWADATNSWQQISWDNRNSRRYGPFDVIPDVGDRSINARPRSVRVSVELAVAAGLTQADAFAMMTRGSHPDEIFRGQYMAAGATVAMAAGYQRITWDLDPDSHVYADNIRRDLVLPSAPSTAGVAVASTPLRVFWLWVGFLVRNAAGAGTAVEILSVSAYEVR